ncbi:helix-turn-helix domain-containing protein [Flavisphingomonas formosensis]|uniref:helix-turn-helix domain-containing protein n=1 Tax=Flavisphingomonas formosensis TaxID=861534 RepID=UPI0012FB019F|nr:helix-turn-helix transcriptional regulator [Sphingomonas formosensis]
MKTESELGDAVLLGEAIRAIRKYRRMRTSEVAKALDMPTRTYEHLEAGQGRISYDRLARFAEVTNSDSVALIIAMMLGEPSFAIHCADNKLAEVMMHALGELNEDLGADIGFLETRTIIAAFRKACHELSEHVRKRDTFAENWLRDRTEKARAAPATPQKRRLM